MPTSGQKTCRGRISKHLGDHLLAGSLIAIIVSPKITLWLNPNLLRLRWQILGNASSAFNSWNGSEADTAKSQNSRFMFEFCDRILHSRRIGIFATESKSVSPEHCALLYMMSFIIYTSIALHGRSRVLRLERIRTADTLTNR